MLNIYYYIYSYPCSIVKINISRIDVISYYHIYSYNVNYLKNAVILIEIIYIKYLLKS